MRSDQDRLADILRAIDKAERYKDAGEDRFLQDELLQVWALYHLQVIGEAARNLSAKLREEHAALPWPHIAGLRNVLAHEYFGVNLQQVLMVLKRDLPALRPEIEKILETLRTAS
jgi:uncharacterized protein with HEPN domain